MNAQHSSKSAEWYTPSEWVELARYAMGGIDLDPASCAEANKIVRAERFFTKEQDGLSLEWSGRVWLNPPGGRGVPQAFWKKLTGHYDTGNIQSFVYMAYSLEQLLWLKRHSGNTCEQIRVTVAIPPKRIKFIGAGNSPTHGNAIVMADRERIPSRRFEVGALDLGCTVFQGLI